MKIKKLKTKALKGLFTWMYKPSTVMTWIEKGDESDTKNFHERGGITWNQVDNCAELGEKVHIQGARA